MATEEIKYEVVEELGNNIEIRDYAPVVIAEVTVNANRDEASGKAFRTLFNYITGDNVAQQDIPQEISVTAPVSQEALSQKIPMTAPVTQQRASQEIPMTAPVTQEQQAQDVWKVAFYMPADMTMETAPKPTSDKITLREVKFGNMIAIRFSGRNTDSNVNEHDEELKDYMRKNNIAFNEEGRILAFYDAPFKPWFLRRNEVLYPLK